MGTLATVAIPALNAGPAFELTLAAVRTQRGAGEIELLVADSGSSDGTVGLARRHGAEVIHIPPGTFSHGGTRNLLMEHAQGEHVAFLTQDAVPADESWLSRLLSAFELSSDVALAFGPYRAGPQASPMVARELEDWFANFSSDARPRIDRLDPAERDVPVRALLGPRGFFTDANGCVVREAWEAVRFRSVPYAEDHALALDMLRAGYAKVYMPDAVVIHSHEYSGRDWLRRSFDEARALRELYGFVAPVGPRRTALDVWGRVGADWRWARSSASLGADTSAAGGASVRLRHAAALALLTRSLHHHAMRTAGTALGARAERLPKAAVRRLSLEGRVPVRR